MPTVLLSGPAGSRPQTLEALRKAGRFGIVNGPESHGYPARADGTDDPTVSWITVHDAGGIARAVEIAAPFGWELRAHWDRVGPWQARRPADTNPTEVTP